MIESDKVPVSSGTIASSYGKELSKGRCGFRMDNKYMMAIVEKQLCKWCIGTRGMWPRDHTFAGHRTTVCLQGMLGLSADKTERLGELISKLLSSQTEVLCQGVLVAGTPPYYTVEKVTHNSKRALTSLLWGDNFTFSRTADPPRYTRGAKGLKQMARENSLCVISNAKLVMPYTGGYLRLPLDTDDCCDSCTIRCGETHLTTNDPRLDDPCVKFMPLMSASEQYFSVIDLYNTYVVTRCRSIAERHINRYVGTKQLNLSAIPIHTFVLEWNKSLLRFHDMVTCEGERESTVSKESHTQIVTEVVVGTVSSTCGKQYLTGQVDHVTVPRDGVMYLEKLYLLAKSVPDRECVFLLNGSGVMLALTWAMSEDDCSTICKTARRATICISARKPGFVLALLSSARQTTGVCGVVSSRADMISCITRVQKLFLVTFLLTSYLYTWLYYNLCKSPVQAQHNGWLGCGWGDGEDMVFSGLHGRPLLAFYTGLPDVSALALDDRLLDIVADSGLAIPACVHLLGVEHARVPVHGPVDHEQRGDLGLFQRGEDLKLTRCKCYDNTLWAAKLHQVRKVLFTQHDPPCVFWCTYTSTFVLYNTPHLAFIPLSHTSPLLFSLLAFVLYCGAMRTAQTALS
ncbi:hypothetical protein GOODEAATRI_025738 [Goodea atripinnis]|uniref:Uncharacterized protein n=1 Tax=Goodea atripinnis TaxID=208336 RepID=A0ABV0PH16_9TELE